MEVNFFGLINVTRTAMEAMRKQEPSGGLIQQVTSIGGQRGVPVRLLIFLLPFFLFSRCWTLPGAYA